MFSKAFSWRRRAAAERSIVSFLVIGTQVCRKIPVAEPRTKLGKPSPSRTKLCSRQKRMASVHSVAMRAAVRNPRDPRLTMIPSTLRKLGSSGKSVRVSQLCKMRECEQVAAVCYRLRRGTIEFLLVQTRGSKRWTFPKGSAEPGLSHAQAAAIEAFEEAGVHGRIEEASFTRYVCRRQTPTDICKLLCERQSWSALISAKCYGSAHRKSPTEIVPGFLLTMRSSVCGRVGKTKMGKSSPAWSTGL